MKRINIMIVSKLFPAVALLLVSSFFMRAADWHVEYDWAKDAVKEKKWDKVLKHIDNAIEERSAPQNGAKTYGVNFVDYFPYYYRGLALFNLGHYKEAKIALKKSLDAGAVTNAKDAEQLLPEIHGMIETCTKKSAPKPKPVEQKTTEPKQEPRLHETEQQVRWRIDNGNNFLIAGNYTAAKKEFNAAQALVKKSGQLSELEKEITGKLSTISNKEKTADLLNQIEGLIARKRYKQAESLILNVLAIDKGNKLAQQYYRLAAGELAKRKDKPPAIPEVKSPQVNTTQTSLDTGDTVDRLSREGEMLYSRGNYPAAREKFSGILQLQNDHSGARKWIFYIDYASGVIVLNEGINRYFNGDLQGSGRLCREAVRKLNLITVPTLPRAGESFKIQHSTALVRAYQFLAVALIEMHLMGNDPTGQNLEDARQFIKQIYRLTPGFQLLPGYFSPKIIKYFRPPQEN